MTRSIGWPLIWTLLGFVIVLAEGIAVGIPAQGDTLSEVIRTHLRFDPLGRFLVLPLWCWLSWHWIIRSERWTIGFGWRDLVALGVGFACAVLEARRR